MKRKKNRRNPVGALGVAVVNPTPAKRVKRRKARRNPQFSVNRNGKRITVAARRDVSIVRREVGRRSSAPARRPASPAPSAVQVRRPGKTPTRRAGAGIMPPFTPPSAQPRQNPLFGNPAVETGVALVVGIGALLGMGYLLPWMKTKALGVFKQSATGPDGKPTMTSNLLGAVVAGGAAILAHYAIKDDRRRTAIQLGVLVPGIIPLAKTALDAVKPGASANFLGDPTPADAPLKFDFSIGRELNGSLGQEITDLNNNPALDDALSSAAATSPALAAPEDDDFTQPILRGPGGESDMDQPILRGFDGESDMDQPILRGLDDDQPLLVN